MGRMSAAWALIRSTAVGVAIAGRPVSRLRRLDFAPFNDALAAFEPDARRVADVVGTRGASGLLAAMAVGRLNSAELTAHYLARIRDFDPQLGAVVELNPRALIEALASDRRRADGGAIGLLEGIPVLLKDNIETAAPMHTTAGAAVLLEHIAETDAPLVAALRAAGAVILGKANLSELSGAASRIPGVSAVGGATRSPYGRRFSPGGSSSGSAVAVSAGLCALSVGTETSGSLIAPAAFSSVVALKPTHGAVNGDGVVPLVRYQDTPGPVATSVADAALMWAALTHSAPVELTDSGLDAIITGVLATDILAQPRGWENTSDNAAVLQRIRDGLSAAGAEVVDAEVAVTPDTAGYESQFLSVVLGGLVHDTMGYVGAHTEVGDVADLMRFNLSRPTVRMPRGQFYPALANLISGDGEAYATAALAYREATTAVLSRTFRAFGAQVLVSVSNLHSALYAGAGYPAITVPLGLRSNGMPTGATFIGAPGHDRELLTFAAAFERVTRLRVAPTLAG